MLPDPLLEYAVYTIAVVLNLYALLAIVTTATGHKDWTEYNPLICPALGFCATTVLAVVVQAVLWIA